MASIKPYETKKGTFYQAVIYCGLDMYGKPKQIKKKGFKTYREADRWAIKTKAEANEKGADSFIKNPTTYGEVYELWKESYKESVITATYETAVRTFEMHILPHTEAISIDKMTLSYCQKLYNKWREAYPKNAKIILYNFARVFKYAIHLGLIKENPCQNVIKGKNKEAESNKLKMWTKEELSQFLEICKQSEDFIIYPLYRLIAYTGLRRGEVSALKWSDIDLERQQLQVNRSITRNDGKYIIGDTTKTKKSKRIISLDDETTNIIKNYKAKVMMLAFKNKTKNLDDDLVFYKENRNKEKSNIYIFMNKNFAKLCKIAKLENITLHGLRHTHCSLLLQSGANIKVVAERLGHKDISMTLNVYTHITKEQDKEMINDLAEFLA